MKGISITGWARSAALGAICSTLLATAGAAQDVDSLRRALMVPLPPTLSVLSTVGQISPGSSAGSPTAFGPNLGDGFVGAGFQSRTRYLNNEGDVFEAADGSVVAGFGLGNSRDLIGLEVSVTSFSTFNSGPFKRASLNFKVHRVLPGNVGVAAGWENGIHTSEFFAPQTFYGVVSKVWDQRGFSPFNSITTSIGVGNGRFRFEDDVLDDVETVNLFANVGVQVADQASLVADWTGQDLALGISLVPFRGIPIIVTPALVDVTGTAGDGARLTLGAGMGFKFASAGRLFP